MNTQSYNLKRSMLIGFTIFVSLMAIIAFYLQQFDRAKVNFHQYKRLVRNNKVLIHLVCVKSTKIGSDCESLIPTVNLRKRGSIPDNLRVHILVEKPDLKDQFKNNCIDKSISSSRRSHIQCYDNFFDTMFPKIGAFKLLDISAEIRRDIASFHPSAEDPLRISSKNTEKFAALIILAIQGGVYFSKPSEVLPRVEYLVSLYGSNFVFADQPDLTNFNCADIAITSHAIGSRVNSAYLNSVILTAYAMWKKRPKNYIQNNDLVSNALNVVHRQHCRKVVPPLISELPSLDLLSSAPFYSSKFPMYKSNYYPIIFSKRIKDKLFKVFE